MKFFYFLLVCCLSLHVSLSHPLDDDLTFNDQAQADQQNLVSSKSTLPEIIASFQKAGAAALKCATYLIPLVSKPSKEAVDKVVVCVSDNLAPEVGNSLANFIKLNKGSAEAFKELVDRLIKSINKALKALLSNL